MRFFDTKQRGYIEWQPPEIVRMYVCGITPYDSAHIGHIFTFMTYDILQRRLEDLGRTVHMVRNITDVDEPIYKKAAELSLPYTQLAAAETGRFHEAMRSLHFKAPFREPRASEYIDQMAEAVRKLLDSGYAYHVDKDIYFDTAKDPEFGQVASFDERLRMGLFKKRGGDPLRPGKRQPLDFLLWKAVDDPNDPAAWNTVVMERGRPGWHIECTVMSSDLLGVPFDLHGGGNDLIFPHHEAEIAQSKALYGEPEARYWLHVAPLYYGGEKMSKSLGNLVFARDLLQQYDPAAIRLGLMRYHYREGGEWIPEYLDEATEWWNRLRQAAARTDTAAASRLLNALRTAIDDDIDTHAMLHALADFTRERAPSRPDTAAPSIVGQAFALLGLEAADI